MSEIALWIGWVVSLAGALAIVSAAWWLVMRLLWSALRDTAVMVVFVRWWMIKYIRSVRRDRQRAIDRHVAHTQKADGRQA